MFKVFVAVLVVLMSGIMPLQAGDATKDQNAAVRYLMAVGHMEPISSKVEADLQNSDNPEIMEKMSDETKKYLNVSKNDLIIRLIVDASKCTTCNFAPDNLGNYNDIVPPFKGLRQLARLTTLLAWEKDKAGKPDKALEIILANFKFGQHLEETGNLLGGMVGIAIRKSCSLIPLKYFLEKHQEASWKEKIKEFFQSVPRPAVNVKKLLESEKILLQKTLELAKTDQSVISDLNLLPKRDRKKDSVELKVDPLQQCFANQRVLTGAVEMLIMDYEGIPASASADIIGFLVKSQYLKKAPVCPGNGKYTITPGKDKDATVSCSIHPVPDTASSEPKADTSTDRASDEELKKFVNSPEYSKLVDEALSVIDDTIKLDPSSPDFADAVKQLMEKVENSTNPLVSTAVPNVKKIYEVQIELQNMIEALTK